MFRFQKLTAVICVLCLLVTILAGCSAQADDVTVMDADDRSIAEQVSETAAVSAAVTASGSFGFGQDISALS